MTQRHDIMTYLLLYRHKLTTTVVG